MASDVHSYRACMAARRYEVDDWIRSRRELRAIRCDPAAPPKVETRFN